MHEAKSKARPQKRRLRPILPSIRSRPLRVMRHLLSNGVSLVRSSALIASASFVSPSCLDRIISKAVASRRDLRNSSSKVVKPTIFVPGSMTRRIDAASTPFILGMLRSRITREGARCLALSMAATPSLASQQASKGVAVLMQWQMASRTAALSSTTRIHGVWRDDMTEANY